MGENHEGSRGLAGGIRKAARERMELSLAGIRWGCGRTSQLRCGLVRLGHAASVAGGGRWLDAAGSFAGAAFGPVAQRGDLAVHELC